MEHEFSPNDEFSIMTPEEAQAIIRLWSRRQWERQDWPTVADVAEALEIHTAAASTLLAEVRAEKISERPREERRSSPGEGSVSALYRFAVATLSLTGLFSLALERLLA